MKTPAAFFSLLIFGSVSLSAQTVKSRSDLYTDIDGLPAPITRTSLVGVLKNDVASAATTSEVAAAQTQVVGTNTQTASYTLALTDAGKVVATNVATANTVTIPTNATVAIPVNSVIKVAQLGAGITQLVTTGVTITGPTSCLAAGGSLVLTKLDTDTWLSEGPIGISVASGKTFVVSNTLTFVGTDGTTVAFPSSSTNVPLSAQALTLSGPTAARTITLPDANYSAARIDAAQTFTGASTATSWNMITPVIQGASASGSSNVDLSGGTGYLRPPSGGIYVAGGQQRFLNNYSTASQSITAATRTYITGSNLSFTAGLLRAGTILRWRFNITKTAAGTATSTYDICFGTAGTTSDTARVSFTKPAGTAVVDEGWVEIQAVVRTATSTGTVVGEFTLRHNLSSTGHATIPNVCVTTTSSTFDLTAATNVGVCITSGASDAITIQQVTAEAINL